MRIVRHVEAIETIYLDNGEVAYAETDWVCDPWLRGLIAGRLNTAHSERADLHPPLLPDDWSLPLPHRNDPPLEPPAQS